MKIRFSVLIPVYNRPLYVRQAIDSVLSQGFTNYEVIVVDDGSTDETPLVLESYGARIKVFCQSNRGVEAALNQAAALAQGEYLCLLDSDDLFLPHALATYDEIIRSFDSPPLILGAMTRFEGDRPPVADLHTSVVIKVWKFPDYLAKDQPIDLTNSKIVVRKALFDEIGGIGNRSGPATDNYMDHNFMLKAGTIAPCILVHEPCTGVRREHTTNFVRNFGSVLDGLLSLARAERKGLYPGGKDRRGARYAVIGSFALWWAIKRFLPRRQLKITLQLIWGTGPMIAVAIWRRVLRSLRKPTPLIVLPELELCSDPPKAETIAVNAW